METRSSRSKRKTGADTPSSQGEEEPSSESDFFHQLQLQQAEADRKLIAAFVPTGGTSATFSEQTMTTEHDMAFIEDVEPPGGSSSSATFSRRTRSHTKRESGSKSILNVEAVHNEAFIADLFPTGGSSSSSSEPLRPQTRSQIRHERESTAGHEIPTKHMRVSPPPGPMRARTVYRGEGFKVTEVRYAPAANPKYYQFAVPLQPGVNDPLGELNPAEFQIVDEEQGPIL
jgi:hypothetical protein